MNTFSKSSYSDYQSIIAEHVSIEKLTFEQFEELGMAIERAQLDWDWSQLDVDEEKEESRINRAKQAKSDVRACFEFADEEPNESMLIAAYVGGFTCDYGF